MHQRRQLPHQQPEIEATDVHEQPLQDVVVSAQMHPPHPSGFEQMREGAFEPFPTLPQQPVAAGAPDPAAVGIHRIASGRLAAPVPSATVRFRDVGTHPEGREVDQRAKVAPYRRGCCDCCDTPCPRPTRARRRPPAARSRSVPPP